MTDTITVTGVVASDLKHVTTSTGLDIVSFRLASGQRRFDRTAQSWVDAGTNWYTVSAFRQLGQNLARSLSKGDRVLVAGRLKLREWQSGEKSGTSADIEADAVGHDLVWGTSTFFKVSLTSALPVRSESSFTGEPAPSESTEDVSYSDDFDDAVALESVGH